MTVSHAAGGGGYVLLYFTIIIIIAVFSVFQLLGVHRCPLSCRNGAVVDCWQRGVLCGLLRHSVSVGLQ